MFKRKRRCESRDNGIRCGLGDGHDGPHLRTFATGNYASWPATVVDLAEAERREARETV